MKEAIYEIPVNDAFSADTECPFCYMKSVLEKDALDYMMGSSYMEADIRMETNKMGFCQKHYKKMYIEQNRLGLALMVQTHLQQLNKDLIKLLPADGKVPSIGKKNIFTKATVQEDKVSKYIHNISDNCYLCNKVDKTFVNYVDTFFYLIKQNSKFFDKIKGCKGFCLDHFSMIYEMAPSNLTADDCATLYKIIIPLEIENLKRIDEEISWFVTKFDYRFTNEPWKNSKDALPRTIQKISSAIVE